jgi:AcrR family transcriptional regulator
LCAVKYELKKRAEGQAQTRRRIVEATVGLHTEVGPAATTISAIAERAGVQRHTVYSHFPDERELLMACSGLHLEREPIPTPADLAAARPGEPRLRRALELLDAYYERNAELLGHVMRDAEVHAATREAVAARFGSPMDAYAAAIAADWPARGRRRARLFAALSVALDFRTWQTLHAQGLAARDIVATAVAMVRCQ